VEIRFLLPVSHICCSSRKMYGLLLEGIHAFITSKFSEDVWDAILARAKTDTRNFRTREVYSDGLIPLIVDAACEELRMSNDDIMFENGVFFITFLSNFGYDSILRVLGRDLRDFLNGLDNLHEYLRFTYVKMRPPSFFCVNESKTGITLQYRSKRRGFHHYVRGQITEIARLFYQTNMRIEIVSKTAEACGVVNCIFRLHFNNIRFAIVSDRLFESSSLCTVPSEVFFEVFPFNIVFNRGMRILNIGRGLFNTLPNLVNTLINENFLLIRPMIEFSWDAVIIHTNNVFELISMENKLQDGQASKERHKKASNASDNGLRLKGQMKYMPAWDAIVFLGTPVLRDVESMYSVGLYINDLSMHDSSRDLILAGEQQSAELKLALEQEQEKSAKLTESMKRLDEEKKKTDELLYQMIPKTVADRLRRGDSAVSTCETFDEVTILFSDICGFTNICGAITPLDVVNMLNNMYSVFDKLTEQNCVYKVETVGDAYMIVSGAPVKTEHHAALMSEMAQDMIKAIANCKDPSGINPHLMMRIGLHTGMVVAGVVGVKMPRYCLFGDTVNTANKMESSGQRIHISATTKTKLDSYEAYVISDGSEVVLP
uniref:guanylate cyclase n=1 Tax=Macrostomum lignano TaxID=282301 RepID=A0A1I8GYZ9_9PLAT